MAKKLIIKVEFIYVRSFRCSRSMNNGSPSRLFAEMAATASGRTRRKLADVTHILDATWVMLSSLHGDWAMVSKHKTPPSCILFMIRIMTNDLDASAAEIAELYKQRWKIELFFKCVKQNLKIRHFLGTFENAVRAQIFRLDHLHPAQNRPGNTERRRATARFRQTHSPQSHAQMVDRPPRNAQHTSTTQ